LLFAVFLFKEKIEAMWEVWVSGGK
jgi:hypothetical protein